MRKSHLCNFTYTTYIFYCTSNFTKRFTSLDGQPPKYGSRGRGRRDGRGLAGGLVADYAEIVDEEGDYSSPARDYDLDRNKIDLSEIIGKI